MKTANSPFFGFTRRVTSIKQALVLLGVNAAKGLLLGVSVPFDLFVVFATNLDPATMVGEAFLRRIQIKIKVDFVTSDQFREIFRRACLQSSLAYDAAVADELIRIIGLEYKEPLRACYPRDILQQVLWAACYLQKEPRLDREAVDEACRNYFLAG